VVGAEDRDALRHCLGALEKVVLGEEALLAELERAEALSRRARQARFKVRYGFLPSVQRSRQELDAAERFSADELLYYKHKSARRARCLRVRRERIAAGDPPDEAVLARALHNARLAAHTAWWIAQDAQEGADRSLGGPIAFA